MKTAIYLRVSTFDQSHISQEENVTAFCHRAGWSNTTTYRDTISGSTQSRPELDRLLQDCRDGKIERICAFKLDRVGRSVMHLSTLLNELKTLKIPVFFTSQGLSTESSNPASDLFVNILCAMAQFEKALIQERIKAGLHARKLKGLPLGKTPLPLETRTKIIELRSQSLPMKAIATNLSVSIGFVHKVCKLHRLQEAA